MDERPRIAPERTTWTRGLLVGLAGAAALLLGASGCDFSSPPPPPPQQAQVVPPPTPPTAPESAPPGQLPAPHQVAPPSQDELQRKRAEWEEQQRQAEQTRNEMQAWQRSRRPADTPPGAVPHVGVVQRTETAGDRLASAMHAWYARYSVRAAAVSLALSQYGMVSTASPPDPPRLQAACRDLRTASTSLLADPQALQAPVDEVASALSTAYVEIKATAESCLAARQDEQSAHFAAAHQAMAQAGAALRPFHMMP